MKLINGGDFNAQRAINAADPSTGTDLATKQYVDNVAAGLQWKVPVRVATTANGALATAFVNGQTIDGIVLATGNRILLKNQTAPVENGVYIVAAAGAPARANDADNGTELSPGTTVSVTEGTANADKAFMIISDAAITIGTTSQTWGQFGAGQAYVAGNGLALAGNSFSVTPVASGGIAVAAGGVSVDTAIVARKLSSNIGNGALTSIPVTHNLGTQDVSVTVRDSASNAVVLVDWIATDVNTVTLTFPSAPAASAYRVTVIG